jgi:hypothetical protein
VRTATVVIFPNPATGPGPVTLRVQLPRAGQVAEPPSPTCRPEPRTWLCP